MVSAMRIALLAGLATLFLSSGQVSANGRFPATTNVRVTPGNDQLLLVPTTFGLLISKDGGETFGWVCEAAIGYSGTYDPDYEVAANGDIYATTFKGLRVSRDQGCSWVSVGDPDVGEETFVNQIEIGPDGRIWVATSQGGEPNDIFVSDDGSSFEGTGLLSDVWWLSVATTPDDSGRVYATGYQPAPASGALLRRKTTVDGEWEALPVDDFEFGEANPFVYLLGASRQDADVVFARAVGVNPPAGDALYRSVDGGLSWTRVLDFADAISAFTIRADGSVIAGTSRPCSADPPDSVKGCVQISSDGGTTWQALETELPLACLGERTDGTLVGCVPHALPDLRVLVSSSDGGATWNTAFRFKDFETGTAGPLECPADTVQAMTCVPEAWPALACTTLLLDLPLCESSAGDAGVAGADAGKSRGETGGCCRVGGRSRASALPGVLAILWLMIRRPRRRQARS